MGRSLGSTKEVGFELTACAFLSIHQGKDPSSSGTQQMGQNLKLYRMRGTGMSTYQIGVLRLRITKVIQTTDYERKKKSSWCIQGMFPDTK